MKRQLKAQQDKINEQSPEEMQQRLEEAEARKDAKGSYRPEGDAAARANARDRFRSGRIAELEDEFRGQGLSRDVAAKKAADQTAEEMTGLDATHELDSIAGGGKEDDLSLGNKSINRSIGSQWKSRLNALKDAVNKARAQGKPKMDVKLEPCEPTS